MPSEELTEMGDKGRKFSTLGNWLRALREGAELTLAEMVARLNELGVKVSVPTLGRWERGERRPPRTKIDAVADVLGAKRNAARERAGYPIHLKARRKKRRTGLIAMMLHELAHDTDADSRILRLYVLIRAYFEKSDPLTNIERVQQIATVFDALEGLSHEQRADAWERVNKVLAEAHKLPPMTSAPENAMMIFAKDLWPPVFRGAHVQVKVEHRDGNRNIVWYEYVVKDIKEKVNKTVARLECRRVVGK
jgi:transcriptional regulator with XRE-family HTH domain